MMNDIGKICQEIIADITGKTNRSLEEADHIADIGQKSLNGPAFMSRVKALIQKKIPHITELEVDIRPGGIVIIAGNVAKRKEKKVIAQVVKSLPEVQEIVNNIKIIRR